MTKIKQKYFKREENLRIQVLKKTVNLKNAQIKRQVYKISSGEDPQELIKVLTRKQRLPRTSIVQKISNSATKESSSYRRKLYLCRTVATTFIRKILIERKKIEPIEKKLPTGIKNGKIGKLIYI